MCVEWQKNVLCNYLRAVKIGIHRRSSTLSLSFGVVVVVVVVDFDNKSMVETKWSRTKIRFVLTVPIGKLDANHQWKNAPIFFPRSPMLQSHVILSYPYHFPWKCWRFFLSFSVVRSHISSIWENVCMEPEWRATLSHLTHRWRWPISLSAEKWKSSESIYSRILLLLAAGNNLMQNGNKNSQLQTETKPFPFLLFVLFRSKERRIRRREKFQIKKEISIDSLIRSRDCHATSFFRHSFAHFHFRAPDSDVITFVWSVRLWAFFLYRLWFLSMSVSRCFRRIWLRRNKQTEKQSR